MQAALWIVKVVDDHTLPPSAPRVAVQLARSADDAGTVSAPDLVSIGAGTGMSHSAVYKTLHSMAEAGWIDYERPTVQEKLAGKSARIRLLRLSA